uniref:Uncharacterized protein n=1 Tax=Globodera rostochiensis TaxID=31243 RepID=A0A914H3R5_GLORO
MLTRLVDCTQNGVCTLHKNVGVAVEVSGLNGASDESPRPVRRRRRGGVCVYVAAVRPAAPKQLMLMDLVFGKQYMHAFPTTTGGGSINCGLAFVVPELQRICANLMRVYDAMAGSYVHHKIGLLADPFWKDSKHFGHPNPQRQNERTAAVPAPSGGTHCGGNHPTEFGQFSARTTQRCRWPEPLGGAAGRGGGDGRWPAHANGAVGSLTSGPLLSPLHSLSVGAPQQHQQQQQHEVWWRMGKYIHIYTLASNYALMEQWSTLMDAEWRRRKKKAATTTTTMTSASRLGQSAHDFCYVRVSCNRHFWHTNCRDETHRQKQLLFIHSRAHQRLQRGEKIWVDHNH